MKSILYTTQGTCSTLIELSIDDEGRIANVKFTNGCNGNLQGICRLVKGMNAEEARQKLSGIICAHAKGGTSCPDQLARAIGALTGKQ